jgi:hypothetical protein
MLIVSTVRRIYGGRMLAAAALNVRSGRDSGGIAGHIITAALPTIGGFV